MKFYKLDFRKTKALYINDIPKMKCLTNSPQCLLNFIPTRENQTMCVRCLLHHNLLDEHPLIPISKIKARKIRINTTDL